MDTLEACVHEITEKLNEPNVELLRQVVKVIGVERTQVFLQQALELDTGEGLLLKDGSRRRTPGGVFFYTVRCGVSTQERKRIWGALAAPASPPPTWEQACSIASKLLEKPKGKATVKLTVIGRPKQVSRSSVKQTQPCLVCLIEGHSVPQSMPKELPTHKHRL